MNTEAYSIMRRFARKYLPAQEGLSICDVGSCDINGTFRLIFEKHNYVGLDIVPGPNVDVVSADPYHYPFADKTFDAVISGSVIEHVPDMHMWIRELKRIMKIGGLLCVIGPASFPRFHRYPMDCWRIYPDGMVFLLGTIAGLQILKIRLTRGRWVSTLCMGIARRDR